MTQDGTRQKKLAKEVVTLESQQKKLQKEIQSLKTAKQSLQESQKQIASRLKTQLEAVDKEVEITKANKLRQAKSTLDDSLEKNEIVKAEIESNTLKVAELQKELGDYNFKIQEAEARIDQLERHTRRANTDVEIAERTLSEKQAQIVELSEKVSSLSNEKSDLESDKASLLLDVDTLTEKIEKAKGLLKGLNSDYEMRLDNSEDELKAIKVRINEAYERLKDILREDKSIRESFAERELLLQKREEVVKRKEIKLAGAEERVQALDKYMKL